MERNPYLARAIRAAIALAIVVGLYCAYAFAAVPYIEPPIVAKKISASTEADREKARNIHLPYLKLFAAYFPAEHWVHRNPKVLANESAMLLIKDYHPLPNGQVELNPCIMIFFPQERNPEEPQRQALILEAPAGAVLQFADGFDLSQAKIGRLTHGNLRGEVTIRSDMKEEGTQDDLLVRTREIQLNEDRIWTDHDVQFRVGENSGHGTQMEIRLLPSERASSTTAMNVAGVQSMELSRNVKMNLAMGNSGLLPDEPGKKPAATADPAEPGPPVEITCRGPFHFDLVRHVATFEEHVDVLRFNPTGASDQMTCELLAVHFLPADKKGIKGKEKSSRAKRAGAKGSSSKGMQPLRPKMLEARGEPVIVRSPSTGGQARCERLRYDIETRTIALESSDEVFLFQGPNQIHAPAVQYQPSETPGGLGMVWASGPGWLRASAEKDPNRIFEARWKQEIHLRRHEGEQVLSMRGRPEVAMVGMGRMLADELHLWLMEKNEQPVPTAGNATTANPKQKVEPDRLLASGNVQIDSASLTAATARMEAWFKQVAPEAFAPDGAEEAPLKPVTPGTPNNKDDIFAKADGTRPPATNNGQPPRADHVAANATGGEKQKPKYNLQGQLIRMQVAMAGQQAAVTDATVSGGVALRETQTALPTDKPLVITGEKLQLTKANVPQSHVSVTGQPATVLARGLTMQGGQIQLDRGENRLWIDGPGSMTLPAKQNLRGEAAVNEQMLTINWQEKMNFNGLVVEFQHDVVGRGDGQLLRTETLQAELMERVDFSSAGKDSNTQLRRISCLGGVYLENQGVVEGERTSYDQMTTRDMTIDQTTGNLFANGPGWLTTVRRGGAGQDNPLAGGGFVAGPVAQPMNTPVGGAAGANSGKPDPLTFLRVDFRRTMEGNTLRKEINFTGEARAIYGPVPDWSAKLDPDDPRGLGQRDVLLNTDRLKVVEMPTQRNGRNTMELEAIGNTLVEGQTFTARADRMSYTQAKDLLVLEGTAKTDAQLWRQTHVGAPSTHAAARKIMYWKDTNKVEVNDARFFGGQFGGDKK